MLGISREAGTEWFFIEPNTARGNFIDFTQNHGVVSEEDADAVIPYKLRDEQAEAVQKTSEYFKDERKLNFSGMQNRASGRLYPLRPVYAAWRTEYSYRNEPTSYC